jgi:hypothetical protein
MNADAMTYLPETLPTVERLSLAFDEMDLEPLPPPQPPTGDEE